MIKDTLILFDIDGTLLYSNKVDSRCFADTFKERYAVEFPSIDWTFFSHVTDHTIFREAYHKFHGMFPNHDEIQAFRALFVEKIQQAREKNPEEFKIVPGALEVFEILRKERIPFGIATGGWNEPAEVKLKHVGLWDDALVLSGANQKPTRVDIIDSAIDKCRKRGDSWKKTVYIGDAIWDVNTCRDMKLPLLGIKIKGNHQLLLDAGVSHVMSNYQPIDSFFEVLHQIKVPL